MVTKESGAASGSAVADLEIDLRGDQFWVTPLLDAGSVYALPTSPYLRWVKPAVDRLLGLIALIGLSPVLALIGGAIWIAMDSPVFLTQQRVGRHGKAFPLWKFRSMEPDRRQVQLGWVGEDRRTTHKSAEDPRITPLGRWLRATRLDELPQFINVVLGDLSLVGPRPEMALIVAEYEPWQHRRHAVKPGVTGLWQISDRGDKLLKDCTEFELEYLESISFATDMSIILRTLPAMARRTGI